VAPPPPTCLQHFPRAGDSGTKDAFAFAGKEVQCRGSPEAGKRVQCDHSKDKVARGNDSPRGNPNPGSKASAEP
jgi:hypothetical protein